MAPASLRIRTVGAWTRPGRICQPTGLALVALALAGCDAAARPGAANSASHAVERAAPTPIPVLSGRFAGEEDRIADVQVDRKGRLHLLVQEFAAVGTDHRQGPSRIHYVRRDGTRWSAPVEVVEAAPPSPVLPRVASDAEGQVLVVWQGSVGPTADPHAVSDLLYRVGDGRRWSDPASTHRIPAGSRAAEADLALVSDTRGVVHLVHGGGAGWIHRTWRDGRWSSPSDLVGGGHYPAFGVPPDAARVRLAYVGSEASPDRPRARSDVFVRTMGEAERAPPREVFRDPAEYSHSPQLASDSAGVWHVVWLEGRGGEVLPRRILHARSVDGAAWSAPAEVVSGPDVLATPRLIVDGGGRVHLFYMRYAGAGGPTFHRVEWSGGGWSGVRTLFPGAGVRQVVPFVGGDGTPGVVLRDGNGGYRVAKPAM